MKPLLFFSLLFILFTCCLLTSTSGLESSFTRNNDGVKQIPLSQKYRQSLKQLCDILKRGKRLPDDVNKDELKSMCRKLEDDSDNIKGSYRDYSNNNKLLPIVLIGVAVALYNYQDQVKAFFGRMKGGTNFPARLGGSSNSSSSRSSSSSSSSSNNSNFLKEERLKFYSSSSNNNENSHKAD